MFYIISFITVATQRFVIARLMSFNLLIQVIGLLTSSMFASTAAAFRTVAVTTLIRSYSLFLFLCLPICLFVMIKKDI